MNKILDANELHRARQRKGICDKTIGIRIYQRALINGKQEFVDIGVMCATCRLMLITPLKHVPRTRLRGEALNEQVLKKVTITQERRRAQRQAGKKKTRLLDEWL